MMTPNKVIEIVDSLHPNAYNEETKLRWISDLDGIIKRLVFQDTDAEPYTFPDDLERELLVSHPFDNIYELYVEAMIYRSNEEYGNYNNSANMFESRFAEYKKAYIREHPAKR